MFTSLLPCLLCVMGWWQQPEAAPDRGRDAGEVIISTDVELVMLDVSVKDAKGGYVAGLGEENFRVFEDNKAQAIKYFSHSDIPVTIGLVIDNSGSMRSK